MSVAIGIMAGVFSMALSLAFFVRHVGSPENSSEVNLVALSLLVTWISGGILVALVTAWLFQ